MRLRPVGATVSTSAVAMLEPGLHQHQGPSARLDPKSNAYAVVAADSLSPEMMFSYCRMGVSFACVDTPLTSDFPRQRARQRRREADRHLEEAVRCSSRPKLLIRHTHQGAKVPQYTHARVAGLHSHYAHSSPYSHSFSAVLLCP